MTESAVDDTAVAGPRWDALLAGAINPDNVGGPLGDVIRQFADLGLAAHFADPANARDQCIAVSGLFESMCHHRGIPAGTVTGFLASRAAPFDQEVIVRGHTAVLGTAAIPDDGEQLIAVDWTARQFDPAAPVPLITRIGDWRAFWEDLSRPAKP